MTQQNPEIHTNVSVLGRTIRKFGIRTHVETNAGIESRWGARFSAPVQTGPGANPASYTVGSVSFPGVKRPGRDANYPPSSSAEVKENVELYLNSRSAPSWPVLGGILPFTLETNGRMLTATLCRFKEERN